MKLLKKILLLFFAAAISFTPVFALENDFDGTDGSTYTTDLLSSTFSKLRITTSYTNAFNLYNMDKYSKNSIGAALGFEYTLLPSLSNNFDMGVYGRSAFQNFIPYNIQLISLNSYSFSCGIFAQWNLPQEISLNYSLGAGCLISDIYFVSAESGSVSDIYYDFMMESDLYFRKIFITTSAVDIVGNIGCHYAFYNEKSENFMNLGPTFGIIIDFKPLSLQSED